MYEYVEAIHFTVVLCRYKQDSLNIQRHQILGILNTREEEEYFNEHRCFIYCRRVSLGC